MNEKAKGPQAGSPITEPHRYREQLKTLGQPLDLESVAYAGLTHALALLDSPARGALFLLDQKAKLLRLIAHQGFGSTFAKLNATLPLDDRLCGQAAVSGLSQVMPDATDLRHTRPAWFGSGFTWPFPSNPRGCPHRQRQSRPEPCPESTAGTTGATRPLRC